MHRVENLIYLRENFGGGLLGHQLAQRSKADLLDSRWRKNKPFQKEDEVRSTKVTLGSSMRASTKLLKS